MTDLESALVEFVSLLEANSIPYMLIGGLAVSAWGEPRSTLDVDITVWVEPANLASAVSAICGKARCLPADPHAFVMDTRVLPVVSSAGIRADLIFARLPVEVQAIERAVPLELGGRSVKVISVEDLVWMKLISERQKDLDDASRLLRRFRKSLDRAYLEPRLCELAAGLARTDILEIFYRVTAES